MALQMLQNQNSQNALIGCQSMLGVLVLQHLESRRLETSDLHYGTLDIGVTQTNKKTFNRM